VFYAPFDEDYGYVTVEAFLAGRPVVTVADAGGVLEFVEEGKTGLVVDRPDPKRIANALDRLAADRNMAARLGMEGSQRVQGIGWDPILEAFLEGIT
jgi:glycosyltransferase involved in cell wall biosynthesis